MNVIGMIFNKPPPLLSSRSSPSASITEPAIKNNNALKNQWLIRWYKISS